MIFACSQIQPKVLLTRHCHCKVAQVKCTWLSHEYHSFTCFSFHILNLIFFFLFFELVATEKKQKTFEFWSLKFQIWNEWVFSIDSFSHFMAFTTLYISSCWVIIFYDYTFYLFVMTIYTRKLLFIHCHSVILIFFTIIILSFNFTNYHFQLWKIKNKSKIKQ